jgi:hypothetical protein
MAAIVRSVPSFWISQALLEESSKRRVTAPALCISRPLPEAKAGVETPIPTFLAESTTSPFPPMVSDDENKFVDEAVVVNRLVVVAELPVAFTKVKFWRVVEPVRRRFERVVRPPVAVRVPVKDAAEEIVWPFINPDVIAPAVILPVFREVEKRLVLEAVVLKKLVVVAEVPVAFTKVKFWRVVEEFTKSEPLPMPEFMNKSELKMNLSVAESHFKRAFGDTLPRSKERKLSSASAVALSELMVKVSAVRLPPVSVPTKVVALTSLA